MNRVLTTLALLIAAWIAPRGLLAAERAPESDSRPATLRPGLRAGRPQLVLGLNLGTSGYSRIESAGDFGPGPMTEVRAGVQWTPFLSLDLRGMLTRHESLGSVLVHAEVIEGRLSVPGWFRPYVAGGFGRYDSAAYSQDGERVAAPRSAAAAPVSAGLEVLVSDTIGLQAEGTYWLLFTDGQATRSVALASLWGATVGGRFYF